MGIVHPGGSRGFTPKLDPAKASGPLSEKEAVDLFGGRAARPPEPPPLPSAADRLRAEWIAWRQINGVGQ